jgi:hypothetical protein
MALTLRRRPNDQMRIHELNNLAQRLRVASVEGRGGLTALCACPLTTQPPRYPT